TAGIRRKSKVEESVEYYSVLRALRAMERSDVVILVVDATTNLTEQDLKIAGLIKDAGKACIIGINKWDLVEKNEKTTEEYSKKIRNDLEFMDYAPLVFISAVTGERLNRMMDLVDQVMANYSLAISTNHLNQLIGEATALHNPPSNKGRPFKIYYTQQVKTKPPTFLFTVNDPDGFHFSYRRYLENRLRETFGFIGTPLRFQIRTGKAEK
ncbi:MAG TPA: GTP-binding protein, partial [Bacillota bacterium]